MNTSDGNKKKPTTAESRTISPKFKIKPLDGGKHCPSKWDLFEYSDKVLSQSKLTDDEEKVAAHIDKCDMCRSIFDGAVYFGAVPSGCLNTENYAKGAITLDRLLPQLQETVVSFPYESGTFSSYLYEVAARAGVEVMDALIKLRFPPDADFGTVDTPPDSDLAFDVASRLGMTFPCVAKLMKNAHSLKTESEIRTRFETSTP